jgi:hypothetical protein
MTTNSMQADFSNLTSNMTAEMTRFIASMSPEYLTNIQKGYSFADDSQQPIE